MSKKVFVIVMIVIVGVLAVGIGIAAAQGNGYQNGISEPQVNAYNNGGIGFVNPVTGEEWNGQQRGRMNHGVGQNGTGFYAALAPASTDELPQEVADLMIEGWLDEQQALAVYDGVMAQFGEIAPFINIQRAESQHAAAWELMFDRYGIAVPELPTVDVPTFASAAEACQISANAEIANFGLYDTMLEMFSDYPDVYQVALALRNASEFNHLPIFQACAG